MLPSNSHMREAVSFRFGLKCFLNKYRKGLEWGNDDNGLTSVSPFLLNDVKDLEIFDNELSKLKKLFLSLRHIRDKDFVELFNF